LIETTRPLHLSWRGFYAILDLGILGARDPLAVAGALLAARPVALQLRAKEAPPRQVLPLARALAVRCREAGVPFVVNDRADLAALSGAWGVHLGQDDLPIEEVRRIFPGLAVGVSTHSLPQVAAALASGADYLGFGPVFPTTTKENPDPVVGLASLGEAVRLAGEAPVVAIGGVRRANLRGVVEAGARVVTAISDVLLDPNPEAAAREITRSTDSQ
jgi:thiamine-phosphate pyrophosphorylase